MTRRVVGLDLGAYSVKLVRLETGKKASSYEILSYKEEILPCDDTDTRDLLEKQKDAIISFQEQGLLEGEIFAVALDALYGQMRTLHVPFVETRKIEAVLPGLLEAEVPFEIDDMTVSWHRVMTTGDNKEAKEQTEGSEIRLAFGRKDAISSVLQMLQQVSINPRLFHLSSAVPYELVRDFGFQKFSHQDENESGLSAILDIGHNSSKLCIFDANGIKLTRTFLRGGKKLTEEIAEALSVPFCEAQALKHEKLNFLEISSDPQIENIRALGLKHFEELFNEVLRTFMTLKMSGMATVKALAIVGGSTRAVGAFSLLSEQFSKHGVAVMPPENIFAPNISPSLAEAFALAVSCLHLHAKDNRFNFRKDEFTWRGDLDFLRSKSTPLILWSLGLVCLLIVLWTASSLVLTKEKSALDDKLKTVCSQILGQKNIAPKKCLATMKDQISSNNQVSLPTFSASDIFLRASEVLPKDVKVTFTELDVSEKKVRISAETSSFENIDKVVSYLTQIQCFANVEKGRAQQTDGLVKFTVSGDIECAENNAKSKKAPEAPVKSKP